MKGKSVNELKLERLAKHLAAVAPFDGALIGPDAVCLLADYGRTTLYEELKKGRLTPVAGTGRRTKFRLGDVKLYLSARVNIVEGA
jgi:hypothetical protein